MGMGTSVEIHKPALVLFGNDLRLVDHDALMAGCQHKSVLLVYLLHPYLSADAVDDAANPRTRKTGNTNHRGGASRWFLHHLLVDLQNQIQANNAHQTLRYLTLGQVQELVSKESMGGVYWNQTYDPLGRALLSQLQEFLTKNAVPWRAFRSNVLVDPRESGKLDGTPYRVFTPFWKNFLQKLPEVKSNNTQPQLPPSIKTTVQGLHLEELELLPKVPWDAGLKASWDPSRDHALHNLNVFLRGPIQDYQQLRDIPSLAGTSRLSPYLHFGTLSPRYVWIQIGQAKEGVDFLRQLVWREFAVHLLWHFPETIDQPLVSKFSSFAWSAALEPLRAWQKGLTGYPIVDAGMRELYHSGWMHNRVRMIVGSFLVKDLHISWVKGAMWFMDTLVDADPAINTLNWQWVAGCGADAAPYFRIFNPITQSRKFDAEGHYIKRWCPELSKLESRWIHAPWLAPKTVLEAAGITLGIHYPLPLVDHDRERRIALDLYQSLKS